MKVTVRDCLGLEIFSSATVRADRGKLENVVKSVSVFDGNNHMEVQGNLKMQDQLLLTSFSGFQNQLDEQMETLTKFVEKGVAALVYFEKNDLPLNSAISKYGEKIGLPIIIIPQNSKIQYSDVIEKVMDKILYGNNFGNELINNTIYHLLNFEKYANFQVAIREAAITNEFQVVLLSEDYNPIFAVETRLNTTIEAAVRMGKERKLERKTIYTRIDVEGVHTYWGSVSVNNENYFLLIVDNEDNYSPGEITKLADIIELAMGMWKYTPERDNKADFIKALIRGNKSFAYTLKDEANIAAENILSVFYAKNMKDEELQILADYESEGNISLQMIKEADEVYAIIFKTKNKINSEEVDEKNICFNLFNKLKEEKKELRIFHITGIEGIEGAADGFRLISETWAFVEKIFPYKRVLSKYELALVSNCVNLQIQSGIQKKNFNDLLEAFKNEKGENKAKQLLFTLETYVLDAGMNTNKTAEYMDVHANTVQYRLRRINELLGTEVSGNRSLPALTLALALKRLERAAV